MSGLNLAKKVGLDLHECKTFSERLECSAAELEKFLSRGELKALSGENSSTKIFRCRIINRQILTIGWSADFSTRTKKFTLNVWVKNFSGDMFATKTARELFTRTVLRGFGAKTFRRKTVL